nr:glycosyltransferase family 4 protein [Sporohalobacter salinus]
MANGGADENTLYTINGLDQDKYDIVHTHIAKAGVLGRIAAKMAGVPNIVHGVHGITFPDTINPIMKTLYKNIEKFCGSFTDKFITVGEDMKQKYINARIGEPEDYLTIHSGMELDDFYSAANNTSDKIKQLKTELGITEDEIVVGKVSKLQRRKGYRFYLRVAQNIIKEYPNVKFLIVGSGPLTSELKDKVKKMGLEDNVVFTGYRTDIADVFSIFDIKVLTSLWEGLPRVLVQAAAVGKPLISFNVDGAWEIIDEGKNGYIVPMKDTEAMTEKLKVLIENKRLREKMGKYSQQKVGDAWSIENMVEKTDQIYQDLID